MDSRLALLPLLFYLCWPLARAEGMAVQREHFLAAEQALARDDQRHYQALKQGLTDYPLYPYLEYAELTTDLQAGLNDRVEQFLQHYADTPLADRLRAKWLDELARERQWRLYRRYYQTGDNDRRQCLYLRALLDTGETEQAFAQVPELWLHGRSQPKACDPVFDAWRKADRLSTDLVWQRIALAMAEGRSGLARYLGRFLPEAERPWLAAWRRVHRRPEQVLHEGLFDKPHPYRNKILLHAIERQTRRDALAALDLWQRLKARYGFDPIDSHAIERRIAFYLTRTPDPRAYAFVRQLDPCTHDTRLQETQIRAALYRQQWPTVLSLIERLPAAKRQEERWRYWRARALEAGGEEAAAHALYQELAKERSYHGFLAADHIGQPYALDHQATPVAEQGQARLLNHPGILRARELLLLGRQLEARREWRDATAELSRNGLMAAADLAESWSWHDQAIFTLARTGYWDDLELRFPLEHQPLVERHADNLDLTQSYVFAVIRQESAFAEDARSPAGARGLMQLMPTTARRVARQHLKQGKLDYGQLSQPATNIALGTAYLREVLDKWENNPVLATASYNAGPHRVASWLPEQSLPADIWVELIPFRETRRYVQRVLSYQVIYEKRLGREPGSISARMAPIKTVKAYTLGSQRHADAS